MRQLLKVLCPLLALAGCVHNFPPTPAVTDDSVYRAMTGEVAGTAWIAADGWAVTAGHLCAEAASENVPVYLKSGAGLVVRATPVVFEVSAGPEADVCAMRVDGPTATPLVIADVDPWPGTPDWIVGYPMGVHGTSQGAYQGHGITTAWSTHGSSGAPISTANGVYGVVTQGCPDPDDATTLDTCGTTTEELRKVLDMAGVQYDTPPDPLPPPIEHSGLGDS